MKQITFVRLNKNAYCTDQNRHGSVHESLFYVKLCIVVKLYAYIDVQYYKYLIKKRFFPTINDNNSVA